MMFDKKIILFLILALVILYCFNMNENFSTNLDDDKITQNIIFNKDNKRYQLIAFSQLSNDVKKNLIKENLSEMTNIFEGQLQAVIKFADLNKDLIPLNDPLLAVELDDLKKVSNKKISVGLNNSMKIIYGLDDFYTSNNQKLSSHKEYIVATLEKNQNEISINTENKQFGNKFINLVPAKFNKTNINFIKESNENKNITF
jgi:hypothetical protein